MYASIKQFLVGKAPVNSGWKLGWQQLKRDKIGLISLIIVSVYVLLALASWANWVGQNWRDEVALPYAPPTWLNTRDAKSSPEGGGEEKTKHLLRREYGLSLAEDPIGDELHAASIDSKRYFTLDRPLHTSLPLGADLLGRDVLEKALKATSTSVLVGLSGAWLAIVIGAVLGALSGYLGGRIDDFLNWFYNVFTSVPDLLLLLSFAAVAGRGLTTIIVVMAFTSWTGTYRLVRAEYLKLKHREYVQAADAIGASHIRRVVLHILPNVLPLLLVQFSIIMVALIKYEAILSFLGFGVGIKQVSWGSMLAEVPAELVQGYWWQMLTVTVAMSLLVTSLSLLVDALRQAFDPKTW